MLEVGNAALSFDEQKTQFASWCILGAPLIAGANPETMSNRTVSILTAAEYIAVNADLGPHSPDVSKAEPSAGTRPRALGSSPSGSVVARRGQL